MNATTRRKRAILRDRRRGLDDGPAFIGPMTGWDLFVVNRYAQLRSVAQLVRPPGMSPEEMDRQVDEVIRGR